MIDSPYYQPFVVRAVLPNTTDAYVLRVLDNETERIFILAWRIEWIRDPPNDKFATSHESSMAFPITVEDDYGEVGNAVDLVVDCGIYRDVFNASWRTEIEAIKACRQQLARLALKA